MNSTRGSDGKKGKKNGGERGIRTPGTFPYNGFQDRRIKPALPFLRVDT